MHKIYATRTDDWHNKQECFEVQGGDDTSMKCLTLARTGYLIEKIVLPCGAVVSGTEIKHQLLIGVNSIRAVFARAAAR
ncbi:MAG: hypothetical protein ABIS45_07890 [Burkholderiales bacterium]